MAEEYEEDPSLLENEEDIPLRFKGGLEHLGTTILSHLSDSRSKRGMTYANGSERTLIIQTEPYRIVRTAGPVVVVVMGLVDLSMWCWFCCWW